MSAEKIIEKIKKEANQEINQIKKDSEKKTKEIIEKHKKQANSEAKAIRENGKKQSENTKHIMISKASHEAKKEILQAKEQQIEKCFEKAHQKLSSLHGDRYHKIVTKMIKTGKKKISSECKVRISREEDRKIVEDNHLEVEGKVDSTGGIILISEDGKTTVDNTFESIMERKKDEIRAKIGKLLFSELKK